ncbi:MAG TPA: hypothetical protein VJ777_03335 [Mycobacterium sp.]|nr:hypothetical protein [Mycobacterium sp.]
MSEQQRAKMNPTPDLTDEQYMEQLVLIAQAISVMPAQREGLPNIATPPPIRPLWAKYMISLGMRINPEVATHKLKRTGPTAAGNFGPREYVEAGPRRSQRTSFNSGDMAEIWKRANPETYEGIKNGTLTRQDLFNALPEEVQEAARLAEKLREQEARKAAEAEAAAADGSPPP